MRNLCGQPFGLVHHQVNGRLLFVGWLEGLPTPTGALPLTRHCIASDAVKGSADGG
jgi:hypothetical protein